MRLNSTFTSIRRPLSMAATTTTNSRISMVSRHLSSTASTSAPSTSGEVKQPVVIFEAINSLRKMTLNRPQALNSLDEEMVDLIQPQLKKWEASPLANVILFKGNGKSFCAGGDVVTLVKQLADPSTWHKSSDFFQKEYATDCFIAKMKKPIVTIMHGNTLGGGFGLSCHAPFRVATESTKVAMPETNIGLFTDVGATFFLSRLDGQLGVYLGLTSDRLTGSGTLLAGVASHYVPADRLEALERRLAELDQSASLDVVNDAIEEFSADVQELKAGEFDLVGSKRRAIDIIFKEDTAERIVDGLALLEVGQDKILNRIKPAASELKGLKAWAKKTRETIEMRSPTSVKLTLLAIREAAKLDIDETFKMEMRIATACCNPEVHPDFLTGVTHLLISKSTGRAKWSPSTLKEVSTDSIKNIFFSDPPPFKNPPLPLLEGLPVGSSSKAAYKAYPHAKYSLPSELEIRKVVRGEHKSSDGKAMTKKEVVDLMVRESNGKVGVREKVSEVVDRSCTVGIADTLKWD